MGVGVRSTRALTQFRLDVDRLVFLARAPSGGTEWVNIIFDENQYPEWDYLGVAPKRLYVLYHTVYEQLLTSAAEKEQHRRFCVRKARNFRSDCTASCNADPPHQFYSQFSQVDLVAIGI